MSERDTLRYEWLKRRDFAGLTISSESTQKVIATATCFMMHLLHGIVYTRASVRAKSAFNIIRN